MKVIYVYLERGKEGMKGYHLLSTVMLRKGGQRETCCVQVKRPQGILLYQSNHAIIFVL